MPAERPVETRANEAVPTSLEVSPPGGGMPNGALVGRRRVLPALKGHGGTQLAPLAVPAYPSHTVALRDDL